MILALKYALEKQGVEVSIKELTITDEFDFNDSEISSLKREYIEFARERLVAGTRKPYFRVMSMLYYIKDCYQSDRIDKIKVVIDNKKENLIKIILLIEEILKYIKSNGNIDLILDKFVIGMREYYE